MPGFEPANSGTRGQHANHYTTETVLSMGYDEVLCHERYTNIILYSHSSIKLLHQLSVLSMLSDVCRLSVRK